MKTLSLLLEGNNATGFHQVVKFNKDKHALGQLDLSASNVAFNAEVYNNMEVFTAFINQKLHKQKADYLIGGYGEQRSMYLRSALFDGNNHSSEGLVDEPRSIHLGTDVWAAVGTPVYAPLGGMVHSVANNNQFGDYGGTIILQHQIDMFNFYTLYGHLSANSVAQVRSGQFITRGEHFASFGDIEENGHWPPHLHFQIITDIGNWEGDYPGVCKQSEAVTYLENCPDPDLFLQLNRYITEEDSAV